MVALSELICAAGLTLPDELGPEHVIRRVSSTEARSLAALLRFLKPGELLHGPTPEHPVFQLLWNESRSDSFTPPPVVRAMRTSRLG